MPEDICPTPCDDDCEQPCHEVHAVRWKRDHEPEDCPAVQAEVPAHLLDGDGDPFIERGPDRFQVPHALPEHNSYTLDQIIWWWGLAPDESEQR